MTKPKAKPRAKAKAKPKKKVTPCEKCKAFSVTPSRNSRGLFVKQKSGQKAFKF